MTTETLPATTQSTDEKRELALLKAIGFDRLAPEQRELALSIANRYDLDPMLKHLVIIDGKPFVTRDGLLWVAHRSGQLDGIEVTKPVLVDGYWECDASVYRKDMTRPFTFPGRFPKAGRNAAYAPEMAIKCAESMALRRAFNVAAATVDERHGDVTDAVPVDSQSAGAPSLAERAAAVRAAIVVDPAVQEAPTEPPLAEEAAAGGGDEPSPVAPTHRYNQADYEQEFLTPEKPATALCGAGSVYNDSDTCSLATGHKGTHKLLDGTGKVTAQW